MDPVIVNIEAFRHAVDPLSPPGDDASIADQLAFEIAWALELEDVGSIAAAVQISADRLLGFIAASPGSRGRLLDLAEAGRIARHYGLGLEHRETVAELRESQNVACYLASRDGIDLAELIAAAEEWRRQMANDCDTAS